MSSFVCAVSLHVPETPKASTPLPIMLFGIVAYDSFISVQYVSPYMTYLTSMADKGSFRVLTEDERRKLGDNSKVVSDFKQNKLEKEAQKN